MNTYDQIALSNKPNLYLSAPETTDKSGTGAFALSNNDLSPVGQPIIYGHEFSYLMTDTTTVDITGNPLFFNDTATFECVVFVNRPTEETAILIDDDGQNCLLLTPDGITVKLFFQSLLSTYAQLATVPIKNWGKKLYIVLTITATQVTLSVNDQFVILNYSDSIVSSTNLVLGGGYTDYGYLIDGVGFYSNTITNKSSMINDPLSGHSNYAASKHAGGTTKFDGYTQSSINAYSLADFLYSDGVHTLIYYSSYVQDGLDYLIVKPNDERVTVLYDIDLDDSGDFTDYLLIGTVNDVTIRFMVNDTDVNSDFSLTIQSIKDADVLYQTPADLVLAGMALYIDAEESIVNCPDGVKLPEATYAGTWNNDPPKSIEVVFKPIVSVNDTIVFYNADGVASFGPTGSITGFIAYLNGQLVTDLDDIRYDQWNHLVLIDDSPSATQFYLNSDDGLDTTETISYMFLTAYPEELTEPDVTTLYQIVSGIDLLNISDTITVSEGEFSNGIGFNAYSYQWSIVGAGGT